VPVSPGRRKTCGIQKYRNATVWEKEIRRENNVQWLRCTLTLGGIIKNNSPRGFWELTKKYQ
jgi:hypothetical protein